MLMRGRKNKLKSQICGALENISFASHKVKTYKMIANQK